MKTFLKAQTASLVATVADYLVTVFCVEVVNVGFSSSPEIHSTVITSAAIGNVAGAVVNFFLGRQWVFARESSKGVPGQALRYAVVWLGYLLLSTIGIYLLERFTPLHYILSKAIIGLLLAVSYNYFMQKKFVFN